MRQSTTSGSPLPAAPLTPRRKSTPAPAASPPPPPVHMPPPPYPPPPYFPAQRSPDNNALARLQWLCGRSHRANRKAGKRFVCNTRAVCNGSVRALGCLLTECGMRPGPTPAPCTGKGGHMPWTP